MSEKLRVDMMETGGWGGIHYYVYGLANALAGEAVDLAWLTHEKHELIDRPHRVPLAHVFRREAYLRTLARLWRRWRQGRPHILHIQSLLAPRKELLLFLLCRLLGIRVVLTAHNVLPHELRPFEKILYRWYYRLADALILHSAQNRQRLLELVPGLDQRRLHVVEHGNYEHFRDLELDRHQARQQLGLPAAAQVVLFFGALRPYKGVDLLIEVVGPVRRACPDALFVVAGHVLVGEAGQYERQAAALGLGAADLELRFAYLTTAQAIAYVCASDLVVLPYREIYQSGVLLWAYSFGRPVLATRVGSFPECIEEGRSGWLVPKEDVPALQQALIRVLQDREGLVRAGAYARQLAATRFGWAAAARRTAQIYTEVVGGRQP
ncbi:MAG: glycosyltransferase family 4 protein [Candidatus Latescibacteria bacterium]|nr:glycosyltransferase family 4 protein [Candidatus Latescibacterota bacterium]